MREERRTEVESGRRHPILENRVDQIVGTIKKHISREKPRSVDDVGRNVRVRQKCIAIIDPGWKVKAANSRAYIWKGSDFVERSEGSLEGLICPVWLNENCAEARVDVAVPSITCIGDSRKGLQGLP